MNVKLTTVLRKERTSAAGKPYTSVGIKTQEHGEKWLSGFANKDNASWKEGDSVEIDVTEKGQYLNFTTPKKADSGPAASNAATAELKNAIMFGVIPKLQLLQATIDAICGHFQIEVPTGKVPYPAFDHTNNASPF